MSALAWLLVAASTYAVVVTLLHIIQAAVVVDAKNRANEQAERAGRAENDLRNHQHRAREARRPSGPGKWS